MTPADPTPRDDAPALERVWTWRLWGLSIGPLDVVLTVAVLAALVASRFLLLPSGPWEWDETLFARGILKFDLAAHFPHPPGFPLWMALGWLAHFFVAAPLRGLQILSAAASVAVLWPLAALGRRVAPPAVSTAAAVALLFAPGVWLHAGRGFSSTPAALLGFWAAALAVYGLGGRRATGFTVLVTAAFLVRPILLPSLALLWLAGASTVRPRRRLLPGMAIGLAAIGASVLAMVLLQGGWASFVRPFVVHGRTHARNLLGNVGTFAELGLVKGVGGVWIATTLIVLLLLGLVVWWRRVGRGTALAWAAILTVGVVELVWLQNRTFPRYAVPFQMATAPLVAAAAAVAAPPAVAAGTLLVFAATLATTGYPAVEEQHARLMPGWEALVFARDAATSTGRDIVVEPGLYPFLSYLREKDAAEGKAWSPSVFLAPASPDAGTYPHGDYLVVTDFPDRYLVPAWGRAWRWDAVSDDLRPLTQQRFLDAAVIVGPPLGVSGWWFPETTATGERFMWGGPDARLLVPPVPTGATLLLDLLPGRGPAPLTVRVNGVDVGVLPGDAPRTTLAVTPGALATDQRNEIVFRRREGYPPGGGDTRPLAVRLFPPALRESGSDSGEAVDALVAALEQMDPDTTASLPATGLYRAERFGSVRGMWTGPRAVLRLPPVPGTLRFTVWAPRPTPPNLRILVDGEPRGDTLSIGSRPQPLSLVLTADDVRGKSIDLALESDPYVPAKAGGSRDARALGIVLALVQFEPSSSGRGETWIAAPGSDGTRLARMPMTRATPRPGITAFGWKAVSPEGIDIEGHAGSWLQFGPVPRGTALMCEVTTPASSRPALLRVNGVVAAVIAPGVTSAAVEVDPAALRSEGANLIRVEDALRPSAGSPPGSVTVRLREIARVGPEVTWSGRIATPEGRAARAVSIDAATPPRRSTVRARGLHGVEAFPSGPAMWTFPEAEIDLPPTAGVLTLTLWAPRPTSPNLRILVDGEPIAAALQVSNAPRRITVALPSRRGRSVTRLGLRSTPYSPAAEGGGPDARRLGVVIAGVELTPSLAREARWRANASLDAQALVLEEFPPGVYQPERFGSDGMGAWIAPQVRLRAPVGRGTLTLTAWAARPTPPQLEVWLDGTRLAGPFEVPNSPTAFAIDLPEQAAKPATYLELRCVPFTPGGGDSRTLGVVVRDLAYRHSGS